MNIGFLGLGIMGKPMAKNCVKQGYSVIVLDNGKESAKELKKAGASYAASRVELANDSDVVITMLPNSPQVEQVILGDQGVIDGIKKGCAVIDMSSIAPLSSRKVYDALLEKGVDFLDAPVSGGEPKAIDGTLAVMVGGQKSVFDRYKPILEAMAASVTYVGESGAGNTAKLCNQVVVALNIAAVSEALTLAKKTGVAPERVYEAIRGGLAGSTVMDAKAPLMMDRNFAPGFRTELHIKDLTNVLETSHELGTMLPLTAQVAEMMRAVAADGHEKEDHGALVRFYEKVCNIEMSRDSEE